MKCICYTRWEREIHYQRPRGKGFNGSLSSSRADRIGGRGCIRKDSCAPADDCAELSPYISGEGPVTVGGALVIEAEDEDGSSRNVSLGLRGVDEIRCADTRPA